MVSRRAGVAAVLVALAALAAGCGVPTGGSPKPIAAAQVPYGLLRQTPTTTTPTQPESGALVDVFFLNASGTAAAVQREVVVPAALRSVLDALLKGPTQGETLNGYTTAIPTGTRLLSVSADGPVVTVNLSAPFAQLSGTAQIQAVEQVVFTVVAETTPATGVLFEVLGRPIDVPVASGQEVPGPVYSWAYLPGATSTSPTTTTVPAGTTTTGPPG